MKLALEIFHRSLSFIRSDPKLNGGDSASNDFSVVPSVPSSYEYEDDFTTDDEEGINRNEENAAGSVHYNSR